MNNNIFVQAKFLAGRILILLMALLMVAGLVFVQEPGSARGSRRSDPTETDPIGVGGDPPPYQPPAGGFSWSMEKRFGLDGNGDGMIDYHWNNNTMTYDPSYVYPSAWKVTFDGCQTDMDHQYPLYPPDFTYVWTLDNNPVASNGKCQWNYVFTDKADHPVQLTVTKNSDDDASTTFAVQTVRIKDYFIVSIGDSYASGQGNPDIPLTYESGPLGIGWVLGTHAKWQDKRCMRSANAGPALAALELEASDPHSSVTFISFACSGASLNTARYDGNDPHKSVGTGILGPYRGEMADGVPYDQNYYIKSQMQQVSDALAATNGQSPRQIDALIISAGGNDIHFGDVAAQCILHTNCWFSDWAKIKEHPNDQKDWNLYDLVNRSLGLHTTNPPNTVPASYDALGVLINNLNPKPANVYVTQYPDPTMDTDRSYCRMLDDVFFPNPIRVVTNVEAETASNHALKQLNSVIFAKVNDLSRAYTEINWQLVDGLSSFVVDPAQPFGTPGYFIGGPNEGPGHGYCADDNWIRRADESELIQGPLNLRGWTKGILHPNLGGQQLYKTRILYYMLPDITVGLPEEPISYEPPTFSFSYSSADLTSQPGLNGWYIRSCGVNGCYSKVVAQALAESSTELKGASLSVNDDSVCTGGVHCTINLSEDKKQVTYAVEISTSGTYRFQFNVQDSSGQVSFLQREIKVDLENPVLATPIGPFYVEEGGSVMVSAAVATDANNVPLNEDVLVDFDWDLDDDNIFEITDEQPYFSAEDLDGPVTQVIKVRVTDRAGRTTIMPIDVIALNADPVAEIIGAPETSLEGKTINLTSWVADPGADDTFSYLWTVKKDQVIYTTGTNDYLSFTPDDEGLYEVSLAVSDDDDGRVTVSKQITVENVDPAFENLPVTGAVNESDSFTLSGGIIEPGMKDPLQLTINWGDGSSPDVHSLPAGSTSFSYSHVYADDNPSATPSDIYLINLSITDGDNGVGHGSLSMVVNNLAPRLSISAPQSGALYAVNSRVDVSALLTDPSNHDTLSCVIDWDDETTTTEMDGAVCSASHYYEASGVYTVRLTGNDDDSGTATETVMVVVFDPSAGFVTGGGWIDSPTGAFKANESLTGRASFGFVSKYAKGASMPTGNTSFRFEMGEFEFYSNAYEWLVVNQAGSNAQFKGSGMINGALDPTGKAFKFMLWAGDGSSDTFRIRIWWEDSEGEHVMYDNGTDQAIGGGNIVIHTTK